MASPTYYAVGTATVANGETTIAGSSSIWAGNILPGDMFCDPAQPLVPPQRISSVGEDGSLELAVAWPGTSLTDDPYEIRFVGIMERSTAQSRRLLDQLSVVQANGRGLFFRFSDTIADGDPGPGYLRLNSLTLSDATAAYIDVLDANGATVSGEIDTWDDSTSLGKGNLWIRGIADPSAFHAYKVAGAVVDGTGYRKLTLTYIGGSGSFAADDELMVAFARTGDTGEGYVTDATVADPSELTALEGGAAGYLVFVTDLQTDFGAYSGRSGVVRLVAGPDWELVALYTGPKGDTGDQGDKGWSPQLVIVSDGARRVFQLSGYVGGAGSAPTANVGEYLKSDGTFTATIGDAVDVRGPAGLNGSGTVASVESGAGTSVDDTDPTAPIVNVVAFTGDSGSGGALGGVPAPAAGDAAANKFLKADATWATAGLAAASQANQEAGSSNAVAVTPGRQQFHPSAAKAWAFITVSGGVPSIAASYNVASITDADVGRLIVTLTTPFSSANYAVMATIGRADGAAGYGKIRSNTIAAGQFEIMAFNSAGTLIDPDSYYFVAFGDQ